MIHKSELKNKYVLYLDKHEKQRISKVVKIRGNVLTVKRADGTKERVKHDKVIARQFPKRGTEEIQWGRKK